MPVFLLRDQRRMWKKPAVWAAQKTFICRGLAGATGLEPATSGVTGRHGATGYDRLRPGITGHSRHFPGRTNRL